MARLAGVDIPGHQNLAIGLTHVFGIGRSLAKVILATLDLDATKKFKELTDDEIYKLQKHIARDYKIEGELRREQAQNIKRLMDISTYRGQRHRKSLPVRGQRTRTNARTRKGPAKTVGRSKQAAAPIRKG